MTQLYLLGPGCGHGLAEIGQRRGRPSYWWKPCCAGRAQPLVASA